MLDEDKTRDELIFELKELREQISKSARLEYERNRAEEVLRNDEKLLNGIFDGIQDGISVLDRDMNIIRVNKTMERWHQDMLPLVGKKCYYAYHGRSETCEYCPNVKIMKEKTTCVKVVPREVAGRTVGWQEVHSFPLLDDGGNVIGLIDYVRDISELKRTEETLKESQQMLQSVMDSIPQAIFWKDTNSVYLGCNKVLARNLGLKDPGEIIGKTDYDLSTTREQSESYRAYDRQVMSTDKPIYNIIERQRRPDDTVAYLDTNKIPLHDSNGNVIGVLCTYEDITERKRAEEAIKLANAYNRSLIEASLDPFVTISPDGKITDVNLATEAVTGYPREKLIGTDFSNYFTNPEKAKEGYLKVLQEGSVKDYPLEIRHRFGHITPVIYNAAVYRDDRGKVIGVFAAARDVTERKRMEEALEEAKTQAEIYLDLMGHDINNLNQVGMGYLELALNTLNLDQKGRELITKPLEALENSSKLIDKVRKIQQINTGEPKLYEIDVARLLHDLIPKYMNINGREVAINYVSGCHCFVMANDLLVDVFSNILGNAVKHSSGPLIINVSVSKAEAADKAYCKVAIEDNGTGVPDNVKKKLFSRFQRGITKASGKGLGLYLVRSLVHYYHGYVWIEDRIPGDYSKGARFVVMIPVIKDALSYDKFNKTKSS